MISNTYEGLHSHFVRDGNGVDYRMILTIFPAECRGAQAELTVVQGTMPDSQGVKPRQARGEGCGFTHRANKPCIAVSHLHSCRRPLMAFQPNASAVHATNSPNPCKTAR